MVKQGNALVLVGFMAGALAACAQWIGIEDLPPLPETDAGLHGPDGDPVFGIQGTAAGVLDPVSIRLEHSGGSELLTVAEDGPFNFATELVEGVPYAVVLVGDPPCVLDNASGIVGADILAVDLACEPVLLSALDVSASGPAAPDLRFTPARSSYDLNVRLLQQTVRVTAAAVSPQATLTVAGMALASGATSGPLTLNLGENTIDVVVAHDSGAMRTYRLTLRRGPDVTQHTYAKASNTGSNDLFGYSIALSGDTLAIGAPYEDALDYESDDGAVYVFRRNGGTWAQEALIKSIGAESDNFGQSVALSGDTLAVGVNRSLNQVAGGAVYVYRRSGGIWTEEAFLEASNISNFDLFGSSVALSGDTVAVGAYQEDSLATGVDGDQASDGAANSGAVYVFRRSGAAWSQEAYLKASNTGANDQFGSRVALSGDTLAVGAYAEDSAATGVGGNQVDENAQGSGAVYVFRRSGAAWSQEAYVKASNTSLGDSFGWSIALFGDILAVGAYAEDSAATGVDGNQIDESARDSGAVYVFHRRGGTWSQEAYVKASNTGAGDRFGWSVALSGDTLAVGASGESSDSTGLDHEPASDDAVGSGAVYLFHYSGSSWSKGPSIKASNTGPADSFGHNVVLSEDTLAVTAIREDSSASGTGGDQASNSASDSGAAYLFH